jgi:hypothetical protein
LFKINHSSLKPITNINIHNKGNIGQVMKNNIPKIKVITSKKSAAKIINDRVIIPMKRENKLNIKDDTHLPMSNPLPYVSEYFFQGEKKVLNKSFNEK